MWEKNISLMKWSPGNVNSNLSFTPFQNNTFEYLNSVGMETPWLNLYAACSRLKHLCILNTERCNLNNGASEVQYSFFLLHNVYLLCDVYTIQWSWGNNLIVVLIHYYFLEKTVFAILSLTNQSREWKLSRFLIGS